MFRGFKHLHHMKLAAINLSDDPEACGTWLAALSRLPLADIVATRTGEIQLTEESLVDGHPGHHLRRPPLLGG
ncbi:MAG: hypothetical protein E7A86_28510 [Bradyrhizobium sp.]|nr:hypothetical protein [Bradyrhizobium sp.]MDU1672233.1 hypothetical protein [Bradyrhizobium sp.]